MKFFCAILLGTACLFLGPNLFAAISVTLYENSDSQTAVEGNGGAFTAVTSVNLLGNYSPEAIVTQTVNINGKSTQITGFETFCLEYSEPFTPGVSYNDTTISSGAVNGGVNVGSTGTKPVNGSGGFDPISIGTAYLYSQFAAGTLAGFNYNGTTAQRQASANYLQDAIWYLENEVATISTSNPFYADLINEFKKGNITKDTDALAAAQKNANGAYDVVVLNLSNGKGQYQSQLAMVPEATTIIAGALMLLPFGISTLRRSRRSR